MTKCKLITLLGCAGIIIALAAGCSSGPLPLEGKFEQIVVGHSSSLDMMVLLPEQGVLQTAGSLSAVNKKGSTQEIGLAAFDQNNSLVQRKIYIQRRSSIGSEKFYLYIQAAVPDDLLDYPYENNAQKHVALLRYAHQALIDDAYPFSEDQDTVALTGVARSGLGVGINQLDKRPREAHKLLAAPGFDFEHPTLKTCYLLLAPKTGNIYSFELRTSASVDPLVGW